MSTDVVNSFPSDCEFSEEKVRFIGTSGRDKSNTIFSNSVTEPRLYAPSVWCENQGKCRLKLT